MTTQHARRGFRTVIGADPGAATGLARLDLDGFREPVLTQVTDPALVVPAVADLLGAQDPAEGALAVEQFVVGARAGRSATPSGGQAARVLIGALIGLALERGLVVRLRPAVEVKRWATDRRLHAAGLYLPGKQHARDAARHALFTAVRDAGFPDPLSARSRSPR